MKILLLLVFIMSPLMGQEKQSKSKNPVVAVSTQLGFVSALGVDPIFLTGITLEFMLGKKTSKSYFYTKFDVAFTPTSNAVYGINLHGLIGAGGYVFDNRSKEAGSGSSVVLNGGLQFGGAVPFQNESENSLIYSLSFLGAELNMRYRYHFNPRVALQIGLDVGGSIGANFTSDLLIRNDFYTRTILGIAF